MFVVATLFTRRPRPTVGWPRRFVGVGGRGSCLTRRMIGYAAGISLATIVLHVCWGQGVHGDEGEGTGIAGRGGHAWLRENPRARIVDKIVTQSSDDAFHCLTITLFYATEE